MNANQLANVLSKKKKEVEDKIVLQAHNLNISYDNELAVKDVSIDIPEHSITAIIGPSGCGKSTLIDIFMGLLTPSKGEILIDGKKLTSENIRSWQLHISHVPQLVFLSDSTIQQNIAFGAKKKLINKN